MLDNCTCLVSKCTPFEESAYVYVRQPSFGVGQCLLFQNVLKLLWAVHDINNILLFHVFISCTFGDLPVSWNILMKGEGRDRKGRGWEKRSRKLRGRWGGGETEED